jgi:hypothetical protein
MSKRKRKKQNTPDTPAPKLRQMRPYHLPPRTLRIFSYVLPLLAVTAGGIFWILMDTTLGETGLPFDESWLPLAFAQNLLDHGIYSYHSSGPIVSAVMAPLQVVMLALLGLAFGVDVDTSFILGIISFAAATVAMWRLALYLLDEDQRLAVIATLLFVLSPLSVSAALSGLPSMPYTALMLLSALFYYTRRPLLFFVFAGLAVWMRPEGLIFVLAMLLHLLYHHRMLSRQPEVAEVSTPVSRKDTVLGAVLFSTLVAVYAVFNFSWGGGFFPTGVAAKLQYYSAASSDYWGDVLSFYSTSMHAAVILFAVIGMVLTVRVIVRRHRQPFMMPALYIGGVLLAAWLIFPFVLSMHTLFSTLPFFLLLAVMGGRELWKFFAQRPQYSATAVIVASIGGIAVLASLILSIVYWDSMRVQHTRTVRSQLTRSLAAANWVAGNSRDTTTIATHLPGALGFRTECRILDMTGVVSPELIPIIGNLPGLKEFLKEQNVDMIVTQRDQFEVVNVSPFWSSDRSFPPIIEVHPFLTGRTHIMSQRATAMNLDAASRMQAGRHDEARQILERSFNEDTLSSRTATLLGLALLELQDTVAAEQLLRKALELDPEYAPAMTPLGDILAARKDYWTAIPLLESAWNLNPSSERARASWRNALRAQREDSLREAGIHTITITQ